MSLGRLESLARVDAWGRLELCAEPRWEAGGTLFDWLGVFASAFSNPECYLASA